MVTKQNLELMGELMSELSKLNRRVEESDMPKSDKELIRLALGDSIMTIFTLQTNELFKK